VKARARAAMSAYFLSCMGTIDKSLIHRQRAHRLLNETNEQCEKRKEHHRKAAAKYRAANRTAVNFREWKRRPQ